MKKKAFTLIEILVVIMIFGIGILGILTMLTRSIGYFDQINMQTRATMLAKEALDLAYQHRDNNLDQGYPWNYAGEQEGEEAFRKAEQLYKIWFDFEKAGENRKNYYLLEKVTLNENSDFSTLFKTFEIELFTGDAQNPDLSYYRYIPQRQTADEKVAGKGFARWIEFSSVIKDNGEAFNTKKLLKVSAHTLYQRGSQTGEIILESFIGLKDSSIEE